MPGVPMTAEQHSAALSLREELRDIGVRLAELTGVKFAGMHTVIFVEAQDGDLQSFTLIRKEPGYGFDAERLVHMSLGNPHRVETVDGSSN